MHNPLPNHRSCLGWLIVSQLMAELARRHFVVISIGGFRPVGRALWFIAIVVGSGSAWAAPGDPPAVGSAPSAAERIYAAAPARLLQLRTLIAGAERQSSTGSGFLVAADGLAITNYHVVSQVALDPKTYRLEYIAADGNRGEAKLLAVDLANDLAVVGLDKRDAPFFAFDEAAMARGLPKGERLYFMGNPLDLGFTINEGIYNGLVERSYNERMHFTGALNPGMSGGPAVTAEGLVVGVNVAKRTGAELVSFLVPARFAAALLECVRDNDAGPQDFRAEIGRQLVARQAALYKSLGDRGFHSVAFGPYQAPETTAAWFNCSAQTNAGATPKPRASINSRNCRSDTNLFVASDLTTGTIQLSHSYVTTADLNPFQFATFLTRQSQPFLSQSAFIGGDPSRKWYTTQRCHEGFVATATTPNHPPLRVVWCAQGYREFDGLYDVALTAVTEDQGTEALVSRLGLQAVGYAEAVALSKRFLEAVQK
jgi:serine protease Do